MFFLSFNVFAQSDAETQQLIGRFLAANSKSTIENLIAAEKSRLDEKFYAAFQAAGDSRRERGDFDGALKIFRLVYDIGELTREKNRMSAALSRIGTVYREKGEFSTAKEYLEKSLKLAEEAEDQRSVGIAANSLGNLFFMQGDTETALSYYEKTHRIFVELKNDLNISRSLNNIANIFQLQGNYRLALEYYRQSLEYKQKINEKTGIAWTLNNIGIIHYSQGEFGLALNFYKNALPLMNELDNKLGQAEILTNFGNVYRELKQFDKALEYHERSLQIKEKMGNRDGIAISLHNIGDVRRDAGDLPNALEFYRRALSIREEQNQKAWTAQLLFDIAEAQNLSGNRKESFVNAERAVLIARETEAGDTLWQSLTLLGRLYQAEKNYEKSREVLKETVSIIERRRELTAGAERNRQSFFADKTTPYLVLIEILAAEQKFEEAFAFAQRAKSRVLLDVLRGGKNNVTDSLQTDEKERENTLAGQIYALNRQIYESENNTPQKENLIANLKTKLEKARTEYEVFEAQLYNKYAGLKTRRGIFEPLALNAAGRLLPDEKTVLLEFVVGEEKTFLFVISKKTPTAAPHLEVRIIPRGRSEIAAQVDQFYELISNRRLNFRQSAVDIYSLIFKDVDLSGKEKIIIAPDSEFWRVPFQALIDENGKYLIERMEISYTQSLTTLAEMLKIKNPFSSNGKTIFAAANSADVNFPLPTAQKQIEDIRRVYRTDESLIFDQANERIFKRDAGKAGIIHLATHGYLNDSNPMYSYLKFAPDAEKDDGLLEAWEIFRLNLPARLVVLSACETGRGKYAAGEGLIGMTWAFFVAGSQTVLVSQWKVEETAAAELMHGFHRNYKSNNLNLPGSSLRNSALKMLADKKFSHPFFWAGFITVGK